MFERFSIIKKKDYKKTIFVGCFIFLLSCSNLINEDFFTEKCADIKTLRYWEKKSSSFKKIIEIEKNKYKNSKTRAEKKENKFNLREAKYLYKSYKRAPRNSLVHKLHVYKEYEKNFEICVNEYDDNPNLFRKLYR